MATKKAKNKTATATAGLVPTLNQATAVCNAVAALLRKAGHTVAVVPSGTRTSVRVKGHKPGSVLGYLPGATTLISCPWFGLAMAPKGSTYKTQGSYKIIAGALTPPQVQALAITALQKGKLLPTPAK